MDDIYFAWKTRMKILSMANCGCEFRIETNDTLACKWVVVCTLAEKREKRKQRERHDYIKDLENKLRK